MKDGYRRLCRVGACKRITQQPTEYQAGIGARQGSARTKGPIVTHDSTRGGLLRGGMHLHQVTLLGVSKQMIVNHLDCYWWNFSSMICH
jgi:hypothetical protein